MAFDEVLQATSHFGLTEVPKPLPQLVHLSQLAARELLNFFGLFQELSKVFLLSNEFRHHISRPNFCAHSLQQILCEPQSILCIFVDVLSFLSFLFGLFSFPQFGLPVEIYMYTAF